MGLTNFRTLLGGMSLQDGVARITKAIPLRRKVPKKYGGGVFSLRGKREALPDTYDVRTQYPMCKSIDSARQQGKCSSCWVRRLVDLAWSIGGQHDLRTASSTLNFAHRP